jgi:hypothetical protein
MCVLQGVVPRGAHILQVGGDFGDRLALALAVDMRGPALEQIGVVGSVAPTS